MRKNILPRVLLAALLAMAAPAARADDDIVGTWNGTYHCGQGLTGLTLIVSPAQGENVPALFFFYSIAQNPGVPEGCYEMSGTYNPETGEASFVAQRWLLQPPGYVTVNLQGTLDKAAPEINGTVDGPGCAEFWLHRSDDASHPLPPACRPADRFALLGH